MIAAQGSTAEPRGAIRAVAFDAFAIFDPRPVTSLAEELFPGKGAALAEIWRTRQFEYTWIRVVSQRYIDFWRITEDALAFAARQQGLSLMDAQRDRLMSAYLNLKAWPDVADALRRLKDGGIRSALLSNFTLKMMEANLASAGLVGIFEHLFSTDQVKTYKPDPRAYRLAIDAWRLKSSEIAFVAFAGWDAAGAKLFGYPTFWVNRLQLPAEELGVTADGMGTNFSGLTSFVQSR
jgi:2-haloacid dehalogenase